MLTYNIYNTPNLDNLSPFELTFGHLVPKLESIPHIPVTGTFIKAKQNLEQKLDGYLYPILVEETRIKPGYIPTARGNVSHLAELKKIIRSRLQL